MAIRNYASVDEASWLRCRLLFFFDTPYYDDVIRQKPKYDGKTVEIIAESEEEIVGFLDLEYEEKPATLCVEEGPQGAVIWEFGVRPEYRRKGLGTSMLTQVIGDCRKQGAKRIQAWTRATESICGWYETRKFRCIASYWHVWLYGRKLRELVGCSVDGLTLVQGYCEYNGTDIDVIKTASSRMYECRCYELLI